MRKKKIHINYSIRTKTSQYSISMDKNTAVTMMTITVIQYSVLMREKKSILYKMLITNKLYLDHFS
jgi:hypothetical protein